MSKDRKIDFRKSQQEESSLERGRNHLLAIGIDIYQHVAQLNNAVGDAQALVALLESKYQFESSYTNCLYNQEATYTAIDQQMRRLAQELTANDCLIIFFSGHGHYDSLLKEAYWVPVNANFQQQHTYFSYDRIMRYVRAIQARHTFLIVDSCYSGAILVENPRNLNDPREKDPSRWLLASGRNEVVPDGKKGGHSPFAKQLLTSLEKHSAKGISVMTLVDEITTLTISEKDAKQKPIGRPLRRSGDKGGQFIFHPRYNEDRDWQEAKKQNSITAYRKYLQANPKGKYREEADWQIACIKDTAASYDIYLDKWPRGTYHEKADELLREREEEQEWKRAKNRNTFSSYRRYLDLYPDGKYADECKARRAKLREAGETLEPETAPTIVSQTKAKIQKRPSILSQLNLEMVHVEGGTFWMGSEDGRDNEKPMFQAEVPDFAIGKYPITAAQFRNFIEKTGYQTDADKSGGSYLYTGSKWEKKSGVNWSSDVSGKKRRASEDQHPVIHVSWNDAVAFTEWLSKESGQKYRLPYEVEWEYAAGGGKSGRDISGKRRYIYAGSSDISEVAWYSDNSEQRTHQVGELGANDLGIYDMSGNVWEWCKDWYGEYSDIYSKEQPIYMPTGAYTGDRRVIRGGNWHVGASECRVSDRFNLNPDSRHSNIGFRLARDLTL